MESTDLTSLYFPERDGKSDVENTNPFYVGPITVGATQGKGRGLYATTDVKPGELLFITRSAAQAPTDLVYKEWQECQDVNVASERVLVETILDKQKSDRDLVKMLLCLEGSGSEGKKMNDMLERSPSGFMNILCGKSNHNADDPSVEPRSRQQIEQIIRRNAFGSDFITFDRIQQRWIAGESDYRPPRMIGLYPLAAMINHSCVPNAIRVFVGDTMIVHACQHIQAAEEIVWSYVPLTNNQTRNRLLLAMDFICNCPRCTAEAHIPPPPPTVTVAELEDRILPQLPSNEWRRYVRVGHLRCYLDAINNESSNENDGEKKDWLPICTELHFALASCHSASTEHLSILHWCYDLAAPDMRKFWVQQLRTAVMTRYGACGDSLESVRALLQHTRTVLRVQNGLDQVENKFV